MTFCSILENQVALTKLLAWIIVMVSTSSCLVLNETGLNPGHIRGSEVSERILSAAVVTNAVVSAAAFGEPIVAPWTYFTHVIAGIQPHKYYKERDVDACVSDILKLKFPEAMLGETYVTIKCRLKPDDNLFDP